MIRFCLYQHEVEVVEGGCKIYAGDLQQDLKIYSSVGGNSVETSWTRRLVRLLVTLVRGVRKYTYTFIHLLLSVCQRATTPYASA